MTSHSGFYHQCDEPVNYACDETWQMQGPVAKVLTFVLDMKTLRPYTSFYSEKTGLVHAEEHRCSSEAVDHVSQAVYFSELSEDNLKVLAEAVYLHLSPVISGILDEDQQANSVRLQEEIRTSTPNTAVEIVDNDAQSSIAGPCVVNSSDMTVQARFVPLSTSVSTVIDINAVPVTVTSDSELPNEELPLDLSNFKEEECLHDLEETLSNPSVTFDLVNENCSIFDESHANDDEDMAAESGEDSQPIQQSTTTLTAPQANFSTIITALGATYIPTFESLTSGTQNSGVLLPVSSVPSTSGILNDGVMSLVLFKHAEFTQSCSINFICTSCSFPEDTYRSPPCSHWSNC
ncbi:hypothetical protein SK128_010086, partial [Halocaridina rubra]